MDFPEKEIYTELVAALQAKAYYFTDNDHPAPAHYDWDRQQYEDAQEKKEYPFNRPGIFFRFGEMRYERHGGNSRRGVIPVTIACVQDKFVDAMEGAANQADYLKLLEWKYLVHDVVEQYDGECFSTMELIAFRTDHDNRNLQVEYIDYETRVTLIRNTIPEEA